MVPEHEILAGLQRRGIPAHIAAGIVTGMRAESGLNPGINEINPVVPGSRGGYGLNQWTGPRRVAYEIFARDRGVPLDDLDTQLDFTLAELQGPESAAWQALQGATTPEEAARIYETRFLRPGIPHGGRGGRPSGLLTERVSTMNGPDTPEEPNVGPLGGLLGIKRDTSRLNDLGLALMALSSPRAAPAFMQLAQGRRDERKERQNERRQEERANRSAAVIRGLGTPQAEQAAQLAENGVISWSDAFKMASPDAGGTEYGVTPQYYTINGELKFGVIGRDGSFKEIPLPEGAELTRGIEKIDRGDRWTFVNTITGEVIGEQMKNIREAAQEEEIGGALGEAAGAALTGASGARAQADQVIGMVDGILNDPALPRMVGPIEGRLPNVSADAVRFQAKLDQLTGQAFLQARDMLKGGGPITDYESGRAEAAMLRMRTAQNEEDFKAALNEFRAAVDAGARKLEEAARNAGGGEPAQTGAPPSGEPVRRYNPDTRRIE